MPKKINKSETLKRDEKKPKKRTKKKLVNDKDYKKVLSIDQGLANIGYSIIYKNEENYSVQSVKSLKTTTKNELKDRIEKIYDIFDDILINDREIDSIAIEDLFVGAGSNGIFNRSVSIVTTSMISGIIYLLGAKHGLSVFKIPPTSVKKCITGNGRANKDDVRDSIKKYYGNIELKSDHEYDSVAIGTTFLKTQKNLLYV